MIWMNLLLMLSFQEIAHKLIYVHAAFGFMTLFSGLIAMIADKGGRLHRRTGIVFIFSLLASLVFAQLQIIARGNIFLALLTPFVAYMVLRGWLAIRARRGLNKRIDIYSKVLANVAFGAGIILIFYGFYKLSSGMGLSSFAGVYIGLGLLSARLGYRDMRSIGKESPAKSIVKHASLMLAAYTAAVTAFVAVNFPTDVYSPILVWLVPPGLGVIGITFWVRKLKLEN